MTVKLKPATNTFWVKFTTLTCIVLTITLSDRALLAGINTGTYTTNLVVSVNSAPEIITNTHTAADSSFVVTVPQTLVNASTNNTQMLIYGITLVDEHTVAIPVNDSNVVGETLSLFRQMGYSQNISVTNNQITVFFPASILPNIIETDYGLALNLTTMNGGPNNILGCLLTLAGLAAITYYGLRWLCKKAGLIPTNTPPPIPPILPPPPTNAPPNWTNWQTNVTVAATSSFNGDGAWGYWVASDTPMPPEIRSQLTSGRYEPLFKIDNENNPDVFYGMAVFDCSTWTADYEQPYHDPGGSNYVRCLQSVVQAIDGSVSGEWHQLMTLRIWLNEQTACFSVYDPMGILRENIIIPSSPNGPSAIGPIPPIHSLDHAILNSWNPNGTRFYRSWSGVPTEP